jgi:hypothetical protein
MDVRVGLQGRDRLTMHQRRVFVADMVDGIPLDVLAGELGQRRKRRMQGFRRWMIREVR